MGPDLPGKMGRGRCRGRAPNAAGFEPDASCLELAYMASRREFLRRSAMASTASLMSSGVAPDVTRERSVSIKPYQWEGAYAEYRTRQNARHDWRLCAAVTAEWLRPCERIILRTSEIIGHEAGFLYDDHFPPSEPEGRGKHYHHIPFEWQRLKDGQELFTHGVVPEVGEFSMRLAARQDFVDIDLSIRNHMAQSMLNPDWAFCAVGFETFTVADSEDARTYLFDGERLRSLGEIAGRDMRLYKVAGAHGFIPVGHRSLPVGPVEAKASVVIIEAVDQIHSVALGFEQADHIYGDAKGNKCFHADPYFGSELKSGEESKIRGRLYLMRGTAEDASNRYRRDFMNGHQRSG